MPFVRTGQAGQVVRFSFDGAPVQANSGDSVAAALMAAGVDRFRTTFKRNEPRLPYCMMGVCFECLVEIDGEANRQACLVEVREGMQVRAQRPAREALS